MWTSPDIENLCERKLGETTNERGHDGGCSNERVVVESGGDVGSESPGGGLLHSIDKVDDPDPERTAMLAIELGIEPETPSIHLLGITYMM